MNQRKVFKLFIFIAIIALSRPCALFAADEPESAGEEEYRQKLELLVTEETKEEEELSFEADTFFRYMPQRRVDAMAGKMGIIESGNECSYNLKALGKLPMEFSFEADYISINNSTEVELPSHLTSLIAGIQATFPFFSFDKMYFRLALYPSFRSENWNARPSAFRIPVHTFLIYQPDKKWTFVAGVATYPDYRDKVSPILGFIYKPNEKWLFNIIPDNPSINYMFNDKLTLFAEGGMMGDEYEVDKEGRKNVVLEYQGYRAGAGLSYKFNKNIESSVSAGGVFGRRLQYRDSLGKVNINSGMYSEFRLDIAV